MFVRLAFLAVATVLLAACGIASDVDSTQTPASEVATQDVPPETVTPAPTVEPTTTLLLTGDIIPARCTEAAISSRGSDWTLPFQPMHDTLAAADITIGSLDSTISGAVVPTGCIETFSLGGVAAVADGLRYAGYDVIAHAANHIKDCGAASCGDQSMLDTATNLRTAGIQSAGSGANLAEALRPVVVERNGVYFAFLAYDDIAAYYHATEVTAGSAPMDPATIAADVANARKVANVVIVMPHWGVEYTADPSERQREFARAAAAAGADLVIGNHPHWVQAHEQIGTTFVAYALGNFVFDQDWSLETQQGVVLEAAFHGTRLKGVRFYPVHIRDEHQPVFADPDEARQILDRIWTASAALQ